MISITLSDKQEGQLLKWQKTFGKLPDLGMLGGHFGLEIIFTSAGEVIKGKAWNGQEIDLTEYEKW